MFHAHVVVQPDQKKKKTWHLYLLFHSTDISIDVQINTLLSQNINIQNFVLTEQNMNK